MNLINALLVRSATEPFWVTDEDSIDTYGRIEDVLSVGDIDDAAIAETIAQRWLDSRSTPLTSYVVAVDQVEGATAGINYQLGDTVTPAEEPLRCVEIGWKLNPIGDLDAAPGFETPLQQAAEQAQAKLQRMVAAAGGVAPGSAPAAETGSTIKVGKLEGREIDNWSYNAGEVAVGEVLHARPINEPVRIAALAITADPTGATGETRLRLMINGTEALASSVFGSLPTDVVVGAAEFGAWVEVYGHTVVVKGNTVGLKVIGDGAHAKVAVTMFGAEPR